MAFNVVMQLQVQGVTGLGQVAQQINRELSKASREIEITVNTRGATDALQKIGQAVKELQSARVKVSADTSEAKTALQELRKEVQGLRVDFGGGIKKAVSEIKEATAAFGEMGAAATTAKSSTASVSANLAAVGQSSSFMRTELKQAATFMEAFGYQAGIATRRFLAFIATAGPLTSLFFGIKKGVQDAIEFEKTMVKVAQVTGDSSLRIGQLEKSIFSLSTSLGVSSKDLSQAALTFRQAGFSFGDTEKALRAVAEAALAPNFDSMIATTEGVIAINRQFKISMDDMGRALSGINAIAGDFAVEGRDIIEAVRRAGGAFAAVAGDIKSPLDALNQFAALFTSVRATTRESAESIATGLRTIFTRLQRQDTIEALDALGVKLRFTQQEAENLGKVNLRDQFVGVTEAVARLSEGLSGIQKSDPRFSSALEVLGGYRQISRVLPLLEEFKEAQKAIIVAQAGSNSLTFTTEKAQESLANRISKTKEGYAEFFKTLTEDSGFQSVTRGILAMADAFKDLLGLIKPYAQILATVAAVRLAQAVPSLATFGGYGLNQNNVVKQNEVVKRAQGGMISALLAPGEHVLSKPAATRYASGGFVGRVTQGTPGVDSFHTNLQEGQYVIRADAVKSIEAKHGRGFFDKVEQGYAQGGTVKYAKVAVPPPGFVGLFHTGQGAPTTTEVVVSAAAGGLDKKVGKIIGGYGLPREDEKRFVELAKDDYEQKVNAGQAPNIRPAYLNRYGSVNDKTRRSAYADQYLQGILNLQGGRLKSQLDFDGATVPVTSYGASQANITPVLDRHIEGAIANAATEVLAGIPGMGPVSTANMASVMANSFTSQAKGRFFESVVQLIGGNAVKSGGEIFDLSPPISTGAQRLFNSPGGIHADLKLNDTPKARTDVAKKAIREFGLADQAGGGVSQNLIRQIASGNAAPIKVDKTSLASIVNGPNDVLVGESATTFYNRLQSPVGGGYTFGPTIQKRLFGKFLSRGGPVRMAKGGLTPARNPASLEELYNQISEGLHRFPGGYETYGLELLRGIERSGGLNYVPEGSRVLGGGITALAFRSGEGNVIRAQPSNAEDVVRGLIGKGALSSRLDVQTVLNHDRPDIRGMLQSIREGRVGGGNSSAFLEELPFAPSLHSLGFLSRDPVHLRAVRELRGEFARQGYLFSDTHTGNIGLLGGSGPPVAIDPGTVKHDPAEALKLALADVPTNPGTLSQQGIAGLLGYRESAGRTGNYRGPRKYAGGGPTREVAALLMPDEYVLSDKASKFYGQGTLDSLNRGDPVPLLKKAGVRQYHSGGLVGGPVRMEGGGVVTAKNIKEILAEFSKTTGIDFSKIIRNVRISDNIDPDAKNFASGKRNSIRGAHINRTDQEDQRSDIFLSKNNLKDLDQLRQTLAHEIGHAVDLFAGKNTYASREKSVFATYAKDFNELDRKRLPQSTSSDYDKYFNNDTEAFARLFAQEVTGKRQLKNKQLVAPGQDDADVGLGFKELVLSKVAAQTRAKPKLARVAADEADDPYARFRRQEGALTFSTQGDLQTRLQDTLSDKEGVGIDRKSAPRQAQRVTTALQAFAGAAGIAMDSITDIFVGIEQKGKRKTAVLQGVRYKGKDGLQEIDIADRPEKGAPAVEEAYRRRAPEERAAFRGLLPIGTRRLSKEEMRARADAYGAALPAKEKAGESLTGDYLAEQAKIKAEQVRVAEEKANRPRALLSGQVYDGNAVGGILELSEKSRGVPLTALSGKRGVPLSQANARLVYRDEEGQLQTHKGPVDFSPVASITSQDKLNELKNTLKVTEGVAPPFPPAPPKGPPGAVPPGGIPPEVREQAAEQARRYPPPAPLRYGPGPILSSLFGGASGPTINVPPGGFPKPPTNEQLLPAMLESITGRKDNKELLTSPGGVSLEKYAAVYGRKSTLEEQGISPEQYAEARQYFLTRAGSREGQLNLNRVVNQGVAAGGTSLFDVVRLGKERLEAQEKALAVARAGGVTAGADRTKEGTSVGPAAGAPPVVPPPVVPPTSLFDPLRPQPGPQKFPINYSVFNPPGYNPGVAAGEKRIISRDEAFTLAEAEANYYKDNKFPKGPGVAPPAVPVQPSVQELSIEAQRRKLVEQERQRRAVESVPAPVEEKPLFSDQTQYAIDQDKERGRSKYDRERQEKDERTAARRKRRQPRAEPAVEDFTSYGAAQSLPLPAAQEAALDAIQARALARPVATTPAPQTPPAVPVPQTALAPPAGTSVPPGPPVNYVKGNGGAVPANDGRLADVLFNITGRRDNDQFISSPGGVSLDKYLRIKYGQTNLSQEGLNKQEYEDAAKHYLGRNLQPGNNLSRRVYHAAGFGIRTGESTLLGALEKGQGRYKEEEEYQSDLRTYELMVKTGQGQRAKLPVPPEGRGPANAPTQVPSVPPVVQPQPTPAQQPPVTPTATPAPNVPGQPSVTAPPGQYTGPPVTPVYNRRSLPTTTSTGVPQPAKTPEQLRLEALQKHFETRDPGAQGSIESINTALEHLQKTIPEQQAEGLAGPPTRPLLSTITDARWLKQRLQGGVSAQARIAIIARMKEIEEEGVKNPLPAPKSPFDLGIFKDNLSINTRQDYLKQVQAEKNAQAEERLGGTKRLDTARYGDGADIAALSTRELTARYRDANQSIKGLKDQAAVGEAGDEIAARTARSNREKQRVAQELAARGFFNGAPPGGSAPGSGDIDIPGAGPGRFKPQFGSKTIEDIIRERAREAAAREVNEGRGKGQTYSKRAILELEARKKLDLEDQVVEEAVNAQTKAVAGLKPGTDLEAARKRARDEIGLKTRVSVTGDRILGEETTVERGLREGKLPSPNADYKYQRLAYPDGTNFFREEAERRAQKAIDERGGKNALSRDTQERLIGREQGKLEKNFEREFVSAQKNLIQATNREVTSSEALARAREDLKKVMAGELVVVRNQQGAILGDANAVAVGAAKGVVPTGATPQGFFGRLGSGIANAASATGEYVRTSRIGRAYSATNEFLSNVIPSGLSTAAYLAIPQVADQLQKHGGTAQEAVLGDREGTFRGTNAVAGGLQGALSGAFIGSAIPGGGPITAVIGAVAGAGIGVASALKDAESQINQVKMGEALASLRSNLEIAVSFGQYGNNSGFIQAARRNLGELDENTTKENVNKASGIFTSFDIEKFSALQDKNFREQYASIGPSLARYLTNTTEKLVRKTPDASANTILQSLKESEQGFGQEAINLSARGRRVAPKAVEDEQTFFINTALRAEKSRLASLKGDLADDRSSFQFLSLLQAVTGATSGLKKLQQEVVLLGDTFSGTITALKVDFGAESFGRYGAGVDAAKVPIDIISAVGGEEGKKFAEYATVVEKVVSGLPPILGELRGRGFKYDSQLSTGLNDRLTNLLTNGGRKTTDNEQRVIQSVIASLNKFLGNDAGGSLKRFNEVAQGDPNKFTLELTKRAQEPVKTIGGTIIKTLQDKTQELYEGLAERERRKATYQETLGRAGDARGQAERIRAEIQADRTDSRRDVLRFLPLEVAQRPVTERLQRYTDAAGIDRKDFQSPQVIGEKLADLEKRVRAKQAEVGLAEKLSGGKTTGKEGEAFLAASDELARLKGQAAGLHTALRLLTDVAQRNAAIQERLNAIEQERASRASLSEFLATASPEERAQNNRGILLAAQLDQSKKGLDSLVPEDARLVVSTLRRFGESKLRGLEGAPKAGDFLERLLLRGEGAKLDLPQEVKDEKRQLQDDKQKNADIGAQAFLQIAEAQGRANNQLTDKLEAIQRKFFEELGRLLKVSSLGEVKEKLFSANQDVSALGKKKDILEAFRAAGLEDNDFDLIQKNKDKYREFYKAKEGFDASERASNDFRFAVQTEKKDNRTILPFSFYRAQEKRRGRSRLYEGDETKAAFNQEDLEPEIQAMEKYFQDKGVSGDTIERMKKRVRKFFDDKSFLTPKNFAYNDNNRAIQQILDEASAAERIKTEKAGNGLPQKIISGQTGGREREAAEEAFKADKPFGTEVLEQYKKAIEEKKKFEAKLADLKKELGLPPDEAPAGFRPPATIEEALERFNSVKFFASGGHVGGPKGTDTVPAWLTPGEAVLPKASVEANKELVNKLIGAKGPLYLAEGGFANDYERDNEVGKVNWLPRYSERRLEVLKRLRKGEALEPDDYARYAKEQLERNKFSGGIEREKGRTRIGPGNEDFKAPRPRLDSFEEDRLAAVDDQGLFSGLTPRQALAREQEVERLKKVAAERVAKLPQFAQGDERELEIERNAFFFKQKQDDIALRVRGVDDFARLDQRKPRAPKTEARLDYDFFASQFAAADAEANAPLAYEAATSPGGASALYLAGEAIDENEGALKKLLKKRFNKGALLAGVSYAGDSGNLLMRQLLANSTDYRPDETAQKNIAVSSLQQGSILNQKVAKQDFDLQKFLKERVKAQELNPGLRKARKFHDGGLVGGQGEVSAHLLGGEYVLSQQATRRVGTGALNYLNQGGVVQYRATGGTIPTGSIYGAAPPATFTGSATATAAGLDNNVVEALQQFSTVGGGLGGALNGFAGPARELTNVLLQFSGAAAELTRALLAMPHRIEMSVAAQRVEVNHTGLEALRAMEEGLRESFQKMITRSINEAMRRALPEAGFYQEGE